MSGQFFSGTREHAILALAIKEAEDAQNVGYFGRTALQKVVYFLKVVGVPLSYKFEVYHYGPFCDQITSDIELLMLDGVVRDKSTKPNYWDYKVSSKELLRALLSSHQDFVSQHSALVKLVVKVFARLRPEDLELYATLHYAYRYETAGAVLPTRGQIVERFKAYKGAKFTNAKINKALSEMVRVKLIKAASD